MNFRKPTTKRELADQIARLGVQPGSIIMLHASLRKIGPVEGRAAGVIEAIIEVLGPQGTLMLVLSALCVPRFTSPDCSAHHAVAAFLVGNVFRCRSPLVSR